MFLPYRNRFTVYVLAIYYIPWLTHISAVKNITHGVARYIESIGFPESSGMGIFFALGIPVDIPNKSVQLSVYFEANYGLPAQWNSSYYADVRNFKKRTLDRRLAYDILINKLESFGYSGEACLLRMICEVATYPITGNGALGDILQILFTPSSSQDENLPRTITEAAYPKDCDKRYKNCPISPLALISHYVINNDD